MRNSVFIPVFLLLVLAVSQASCRLVCIEVEDPFWEHGWMNLTAASAAIVLTSNLVFRLHVLLMWQLI